MACRRNNVSEIAVDPKPHINGLNGYKNSVNNFHQNGIEKQLANGHCAKAKSVSTTMVCARTREVRVCRWTKVRKKNDLFRFLFSGKNCWWTNRKLISFFLFAIRRNFNNVMEKSAEMNSLRRREVSMRLTPWSPMVNKRRNRKNHSSQSHLSPPGSHTWDSISWCCWDFWISCCSHRRWQPRRTETWVMRFMPFTIRTITIKFHYTFSCTRIAHTTPICLPKSRFNWFDRLSFMINLLVLFVILVFTDCFVFSSAFSRVMRHFMTVSSSSICDMCTGASAIVSIDLFAVCLARKLHSKIASPKTTVGRSSEFHLCVRLKKKNAIHSDFNH